jgi:hypothetical protein
LTFNSVGKGQHKIGVYSFATRQTAWFGSGDWPDWRRF